jgi:hypothetical protein
MKKIAPTPFQAKGHMTTEKQELYRLQRGQASANGARNLKKSSGLLCQRVGIKYDFIIIVQDYKISYQLLEFPRTPSNSLSCRSFGYRGRLI